MSLRNIYDLYLLLLYDNFYLASHTKENLKKFIIILFLVIQKSTNVGMVMKRNKIK